MYLSYGHHFHREKEGLRCRNKRWAAKDKSPEKGFGGWRVFSSHGCYLQTSKNKLFLNPDGNKKGNENDHDYGDDGDDIEDMVSL